MACSSILHLQVSPMSSHYIPEKQGSFQASPQGLTSVKLFLGERRYFQSFKALLTLQLFFSMPQQGSSSNIWSLYCKRGNFLHSSDIQRGKKICIIYTYAHADSRIKMIFQLHFFYLRTNVIACLATKKICTM